MPNSIKARRRMSSKLRNSQKETPHPGTKTQWKYLKLPRLLFTLLFHPTFIVVAIMLGLMGLKTYHFVMTGPRIMKAARTKPSTSVPRPVGGFAPSSTIISKPRPEIERSRRVKRDDEYVNVLASINTTRAIPLTALDDMIIDADTPLPASQCLDESLEQRLIAYDDKQRETTPRLSEHGENCTSNDDCLLLSPYMWDKDVKDGESCRKPTYLRCNVTEAKCVCQDRFDLRWDTYTNQSTYQWNPITKTCYVRATNPCKHEVPCAPGTTCRATVSISYNTPPIQRICECIDIRLIVFAGNKEWWYCKQYFQRTWFLHVDNINKREHRPFHIYARLTDEKAKNTTLDEPKAGAGARAGSEGV